MNDLRFAIRQFLQHPGFIAVTALSLEIGRAISRSVQPGKAKLLFGVQPPDS
jgi:hypothetical protein